MSWTAAETAAWVAYKALVKKQHNGLVEQIKTFLDSLDGNPSDDRPALNAMFDKWKL